MDVVIFVLIGVTSLVLVVPGLYLFTRVAVVGPVVNIERRSVFGTFLRTWQMTSGNFWLVWWLVTVPVLVEGVIEDLIHGAIDHDRVLAVALATAAGVLIACLLGVMEVTLARELVHQRPRIEEPV